VEQGVAAGKQNKKTKVNEEERGKQRNVEAKRRSKRETEPIPN
jgi:hypothetical protein